MRPGNGEIILSDFYFKQLIPGKGEVLTVEFPAHISTVNDSSSPGWRDSYDMGRADPKMFYGNMSRDISLNFYIIALDSNELKDNKDKMSKLGLMTYPVYSSGLGFNGSHTRINIGNLVNCYGVITSLTYNWDNETPWIDKQPIYCSVDMSIKVLANRIGIRPRHNSLYF